MYFKEILVVCMAALVIVVATIGMLFGLSINSCNNFTELTGNECKPFLFDSSYVKIDGKWVRYDIYKAERVAGHLTE